MKRWFYILWMLIALPVGIMAQDYYDIDVNHIKITSSTELNDKEELLICPMDLMEEGFCFPLPGCKILSHYGMRDGRMHSGWDIKTFANDTIRCAFDGEVVMSEWFAAYGNCVIVRHPNGLETLYSHNVKNLVKKGEKVKAGTPLSLEGHSGRATGDHLHFETRVNNQHFDPNLLFDFENHRLRKDCLRITKKKSGIKVKKVK
ncbi:MAG: M23 family metallopeptidase [Bacteroidaceae bacterium]|nr:M23 family metallopeptidase [Bacteroidaceae bacterium]